MTDSMPERERGTDEALAPDTLPADSLSDDDAAIGDTTEGLPAADFDQRTSEAQNDEKESEDEAESAFDPVHD